MRTASAPVNVADAAPLGELSEAVRANAPLRSRVLRPHVEDGVPLIHTTRDAGVPERTAQRWLSRYRGVPTSWARRTATRRSRSATNAPSSSR